MADFDCLVGVSCGLAAEENYLLRQYYVQALAAVGVQAVILPPPLSWQDNVSKPALAARAAVLAWRLDGLLLSGGGDFRPQLWGEYPHLSPALASAELAREDWELALLQAFLAERPDTLPHQQALPPEQFSHSVCCRGRLAEWLAAEQLAVNSVHHQGVRLLGRGLQAAALAPDGLIEAVCLPGPGFALGVQWHPERLQDEASKRLWRRFAAACRAD